MNPHGCCRLSRYLVSVLAGVVLAMLTLPGGRVSAAMVLPPIVILDALPEAPEGWELTDSRGRASISSEGGYSQAQRTYAAGAGVRARTALLLAQGDASVGPLDIRMEVFDTAGNPLAKMEFVLWRESGSDPAAGSEAVQPVATRVPGQAPKMFFRLAGHKAIATMTENGPLKISVLVNDRFVVRAEFSPMATIEQATPWIAGIDARALARYRHSADMQVRGPGELNLVTDELNPFTVRVITERGGKEQEIQRITRSFRTAPADMSQYDKELEDAIARGEVPAEPTEEEYAEMEKLRAKLESGGGYDPEGDVEAMREMGLLPKVAPQPGPAPEAERQ